MSAVARHNGDGDNRTKTLQVSLLKRTLASSAQDELVAISKGMWADKLLQQSPPVLNWGSRLMQVVLYSGHNMVVVVAENI